MCRSTTCGHPLCQRPAVLHRSVTHQSLCTAAQPPINLDSTGAPLAQRSAAAPSRDRRQLRVAAKIKDPDLDDEVAAIKGPPPIMWRVLAALTYLIPWIDVISLGREVYRNFPSTLWVYFFPGRHKYWLAIAGVFHGCMFVCVLRAMRVWFPIAKNNTLLQVQRSRCTTRVNLPPW